MNTSNSFKDVAASAKKRLRKSRPVMVNSQPSGKRKQAAAAAPFVAINGNKLGKRLRPAIVFSNRQLDDVTREALDALRASNSPPVLFVRGGRIVRMRGDENGRPVIDVAREPELRARLASVCDAIHISESGAVSNCFPSHDVVNNIVALNIPSRPSKESSKRQSCGQTGQFYQHLGTTW